MKYVIALIAFIVAFYTAFYFYDDYQTQKEYEASIAPIRQAARAAEQYYQESQRLDAEYRRMLQSDTYGGTTPEETLALFVEALKNKDAKLAAKYYLPDKWDEAEKDLQDWMDNYPDAFQKFLHAYQKQIFKRGKRIEGRAAIKIYDADDDKYPYIVEFRLNPVNRIWKISEF